MAAETAVAGKPAHVAATETAAAGTTKTAATTEAAAVTTGRGMPSSSVLREDRLLGKLDK